MKSIKLLRIGALVLGWVLIFTLILVVGIRITTIAEHGYVSVLGYFFIELGNVFLAFLVAAVFRMIEKNAPVRIKKARRLMIACCLSYLVDAIIRSGAFILAIPVIIKLFHNRPDWLNLLQHSYIGIPPFAPFLYAAAIFVLFTHFSKMVQFESEVA
ncbi:MAG: hypothetical protein JW927_00750 [Deltaproteobacteria bacterium]|nr:hypothetical protein [Deltaproteobacteria bacterium]